MRKKALLLLAAATAALALSLVCLLVLNNLKQARQARHRALLEAQARAEQETRAAQLERERNHLAQQNEELTSLATGLRETQARQGSNLNTLASRLSNPNPQAPTPAEGGPGSGQGMSEMMQKLMSDPAMRDMMRTQQKQTINQMYGALFKELNLSPEQKQQFMDILLDQMMSGMTNAGSLFQGESPARAEALQTMKEQELAMQTKLKNLLGDESYARYEDYQKTVGDRLAVNSLRQQLDGTGAPLRDEQAAQLMEIMREEKGRVPPVIPENANGAAEALQALGSAETVERQLQWQEDYQQRLLERARQVLTPDQLKEYEQFLASQLAMQKMTMTMAREMFGGTKPATDPARPIQSIPTPPK